MCSIECNFFVDCRCWKKFKLCSNLNNDIANYSIRISLSEEINEDALKSEINTKNKFFRYKNRYMVYSHDKNFRYDFSEVRNAENTSIGDVLKDFIQSSKLEKGLDKVGVKEAWHGVMGKAISNYTTNILLERDTLFVRLSSSVLREELSYGKEKIIKLLNEELGKELVKKLVLR